MKTSIDLLALANSAREKNPNFKQKTSARKNRGEIATNAMAGKATVGASACKRNGKNTPWLFISNPHLLPKQARDALELPVKVGEKDIIATSKDYCEKILNGEKTDEGKNFIWYRQTVAPENWIVIKSWAQTKGASEQAKMVISDEIIKFIDENISAYTEEKH